MPLSLVVGHVTRSQVIPFRSLTHCIAKDCPFRCSGSTVADAVEKLERHVAAFHPEVASRGFESRFANSPTGSTASGSVPNADNHQNGAA